jgi:hypothetical protein
MWRFRSVVMLRGERGIPNELITRRLQAGLLTSGTFLHTFPIPWNQWSGTAVAAVPYGRETPPFLGAASRSQWRGRGGLSPPSLFSRADFGKKSHLHRNRPGTCAVMSFSRISDNRSARCSSSIGFSCGTVSIGEFQAKEEGESSAFSGRSHFDPPFPSKDRPPSSAGLRTRGLCIFCLPVAASRSY